MLARKQALLALAVITCMPIASWAAPETTQPYKDNLNVACPYAGPNMMGMGRGYGPGMMHGRRNGDGFHRGPRLGFMNDADDLKTQLDKFKDPKVKAKYIEMIKAHIAFEQSQLESISSLLDSQK